MTKQQVTFLFLFGAAVLLLALAVSLAAQTFFKTRTISIGQNKLLVEVVKTPQDMIKGLSGRLSLKENSGMLFVYQKPSTPSFWMKDMKFPLDFIWIGSNKKIVGLTQNISPNSFPQIFTPASEVQYVLEVNGGWVQAHNVKIGDAVANL